MLAKLKIAKQNKDTETITAINKEINYYKRQKNYTLEDFNKQPQETDETYFTRLTLQSNEYFFHYYNSEHKKILGLYKLNKEQVPLLENWYLFFKGFFKSEFNTYEFARPARAYTKGRGLCSQNAIFIANTLKKNGYKKIGIAGLPGHVVTVVKLNNKEYILDGDVGGVVIPHSLATIKKNPKLIHKYYDTLPNFVKNKPTKNFASYTDYLEHIYKTHNPDRINALDKYFRNINKEIETGDKIAYVIFDRTGKIIPLDVDSYTELKEKRNVMTRRAFFCTNSSCLRSYT
jgi:hypothetical protein